MPSFSFRSDASSGAITCDGHVVRNTVDGESFAIIRAGVGTVRTHTACQAGWLVAHGAGVDTFTNLYRGFMHFNLAPLVRQYKVIDLSAAILSFVSPTNGAPTGLGSTNVHIVESTATDANVLVVGDFSHLGSTSFGSISLDSIVANGASYNDITLNASALTYLSSVLAGSSKIAKLASRLEWDLNNSFTGTWAASAATGVEFRTIDFSADVAVKLTLTATVVSLYPASRSGKRRAGHSVSSPGGYF